MGAKENGGGEKGPRKNSSVSEASFRWGLRGGPTARAASLPDPQSTPGHPPSSADTLDTKLLKATEMLDTFLM